jgi:hypothetical protein
MQCGRIVIATPTQSSETCVLDAARRPHGDSGREIDYYQEAITLQREVRTELVRWLHHQKRQSETSIWDRPITITLLGTVVLGLLTTAWQMSETRRQVQLAHDRTLTNQRMELLKDMPKTYEILGTALNNLFETVLWIAEETNKLVATTGEAKKRSEEAITKWKALIVGYDAQLVSTEPLDGILARVGIVYASRDVRDGAATLLTKWTEFRDAFERVNGRWNASQSMAAEDIKEMESVRQARKGALEASKSQLLTSMTNELFSRQH